VINKGGKTLTIFVVLLIILLLSSTSIGFYLYHLEERMHKNVQKELDISRADGLKLQAQLKDIQGQLALAEDKNKEAGQKINNLLDEKDLNEGLRTALKKENADLKVQITTLDLSKRKLKADLDAADAKLSQYQELLKAAQDKSKELETHFSALAESVKKSKPAVVPPVSKGKDKVDLGKIVVKPPEGTQGHILTVDTQAEFVIFNLGLKQGVKPNDLLSVYRENDYLGDIKATRVQDEMSAADVVPPLTAKQISKNDTVVLKP
jgi:hypothetical protein